MARERYLVGVNQEELTPPTAPQKPETPKGKLENFWYHYKWVTLGVLFAVIVATILIVQAATKPRYDYTICIAVPQELSSQMVERLEKEFAAVGKDRNGDGEVKVSVQVVNISNKLSVDQQTANSASLTAKLMTRDVYLFAFGTEYYENTLSPMMTDGTFFKPLGLKDDGIGADGTYWNWNGSTLLQLPEFAEPYFGLTPPKDLYFGVRNLDKLNEKQAAELVAHMDLLKAFITAHA